MCTATLISLPDRLRLAFNRDESPARLPAVPPQVRRFGSRTALLPVDSASDGTWIAVNDAGMILALLNRNPTPAPGSQFEASRGVIIPSLLHCDNLASAKILALALAERRFAPFRLLLADQGAIIELAVRDQTPVVTEYALAPVQGKRAVPLLFTSSGLGDALVRAPRQQLFDEMFRTGPDWAAQQDAYHRHSWPDRQHVSVCMRRDRARTVSFTLVELAHDSATLTYYPQAPDESGSAHTQSLRLSTS